MKKTSNIKWEDEFRNKFAQSSNNKIALSLNNEKMLWGKVEDAVDFIRSLLKEGTIQDQDKWHRAGWEDAMKSVEVFKKLKEKL